jgi:hypothetical protein
MSLTYKIEETFGIDVTQHATVLANVGTGLLADMYCAKLQDDMCDEIVAEMDAAGIGHSVLLCADFTYDLKGKHADFIARLTDRQGPLVNLPKRDVGLFFDGNAPRVMGRCGDV